MKKNIKNKVFYFAILPAFIICLCILVGCSKSTNTLESISSNMDRVSETLNNIEEIKSLDLIISDFMDENALKELPTEYQQNNIESNAMYTYIAKISVLNNSICGTVKINNEINGLKKQLIAKSQQIKCLADQAKRDKTQLTKQNFNTLFELNDTMMSNTTRAGLTKNEVKANFHSINELKKEYSQKPELLGSRYEKLKGSLSTRLSYFNNIYTNMQKIEHIITGNTTKTDDISKSIVDESSDKENLDMFQNKNQQINNKNIDSYENAGVRFRNGSNNSNQIYNADNYLNNGYYVPPYVNGGYGARYGNIYGFGAGIPYGYGGFRIPNINSFGAYKNIDTYRSRVKRNDNINNTDINIKQQEANSSKDINNGICLTDNPLRDAEIFITNINNDMLPTAFLFEVLTDNKMDANEFIIVIFAPNEDETQNRIPPEWIRNQDSCTEKDTFSKEENNEDGEDKFVVAPYKQPKIERLNIG